MNCSKNVVLAVPADPVIKVTEGFGRPPQMILSSPIIPVVVLSISRLMFILLAEPVYIIMRHF